jgi:hypothetical protein
MLHPEQLCETCQIETSCNQVTTLDHALVGVKLITKLLVSTEFVQRDFADEIQKEAIEHCSYINLVDDCPVIVHGRIKNQ